MQTYENFKNAKTQQAVYNWEEEISNSSYSDHKYLSVLLAFRYKNGQGPLHCHSIEFITDSFLN